MYVKSVLKMCIKSASADKKIISCIRPCDTLNVYIYVLFYTSGTDGNILLCKNKVRYSTVIIISILNEYLPQFCLLFLVLCLYSL